MAAVARALWLILATVAACAGVGWALWAFHNGAEHVLSIFAALRYLGVVAVLGALAYTLHRFAFRVAPPEAAARAAHDTVIAGVLGGPFLYMAIDLAATIRDCSFGTGC
jgi:hypothetical protein